MNRNWFGKNWLSLVKAVGILAVCFLVNVVLIQVWFTDLAIDGEAIKKNSKSDLMLVGIIMCIPAAVVYVCWFVKYAQDKIHIWERLRQREIFWTVINFLLCAAVGVILEIFILLSGFDAAKLFTLSVQTLIESLIMSVGLLLAFLVAAPKK